jgi:hypothetical protein
MRLGSPPGDVLDLSIVGYQFPEAADPGQRYSWHMIAGRASTPLQTWELRWSALTCDESVRLTGWLVQVAEAAARTTSDPEPALITQASFTEPDLAFAVLAVHDGQVTMRVELDLELHAEINPRRMHPGGPSVLLLEVPADQLRQAASDWAGDVTRFPAGS